LGPSPQRIKGTNLLLTPSHTPSTPTGFRGNKSLGRIRPKIEKRRATFRTCQALLAPSGVVFLEQPHAGIDNVFDKKYYEYLSYQRDPFATGVKVPEPGRTFYVNVSYTF